MKNTIIHTADTHLRDTQYGYPSRGADFRDSMRRIVDNACYRRDDISAILHSGDLLDNTRPSPATMRFLNEIHDKLCKAGIPMYIISGNHDRTSPSWTDTIVPHPDGNCGIICADNLTFAVPVGNRVVHIHGIPFCSKEDLLLKIQNEVPANVSLLMWHGAVQEFVKFPMDTAIEAEEFPKNRFDAILTGDIHVSQVLVLSDGKTKVVSPGSTEVCAANEPLEKSVMELYFTDDGKLAGINAVPIKTRKVLCFRLISEQDLNDAVDEVKKHASMEPMILVRHNPELLNVLSRLNTAVDRSKCILKVSSLPVSKMGVLTVQEEVEKVTPGDLLSTFIPAGTPLHMLGVQLINPDVNEKDALEKILF